MGFIPRNNHSARMLQPAPARHPQMGVDNVRERTDTKALSRQGGLIRVDTTGQTDVVRRMLLEAAQ